MRVYMWAIVLMGICPMCVPDGWPFEPVKGANGPTQPKEQQCSQ